MSTLRNHARGLGVGGIALALAAQKTVEHLFGGASLVADQPVVVVIVWVYYASMILLFGAALTYVRSRKADRAA